MKTILILLFLIISLYSREYKVGFAQDTLANDWRLSQVNDVRNHISKYKNITLTVKNAQASISNQISDIEYFIKNNYDFIITSPINEKISSLVLKKAIKKGIKVILIDRGISTTDYTTFITPDNNLIAKKAANYMIDKLKGKKTILMIEGIKGSTPTIHRTAGFLSVIEKYPNIKVITRRANFLRSDAINMMESIYDNNIKFDAIYSHSDSMLSGVRTVMDKYNKDKSILMVGIDYIDEAKEAILKGNQTVSFTYPTCGKEGVEAIIKIINNQKIKKNKIIESIMITKDNAKNIAPIF